MSSKSNSSVLRKLLKKFRSSIKFSKISENLEILLQTWQIIFTSHLGVFNMFTTSYKSHRLSQILRKLPNLSKSFHKLQKDLWNLGRFKESYVSFKKLCKSFSSIKFLKSFTSIKKVSEISKIFRKHYEGFQKIFIIWHKLYDWFSEIPRTKNFLKILGNFIMANFLLSS